MKLFCRLARFRTRRVSLVSSWLRAAFNLFSDTGESFLATERRRIESAERQPFTFREKALVICLPVFCALTFPFLANAEGTWIKVQQLAPNGIETMLLLPDGTVMAHAGSNQATTVWYRLTPGSTGGYTNGVWSTRASMSYTRLYYSSAVLLDGRVFVAGAEYGNGTTNAEIYTPASNSWAKIPVPAGLVTTNNTINSSGGNTAGFLDADCKVLPDGRVMSIPVFPAVYGRTVIFDPASNTLSAGPSVLNGYNEDEASTVKLPDDSILVVDSFTTTSERYIPALNQWIDDATMPVNLYDPYGGEAGPAFLLPNGKAFFLGSTPVTALYTPSGTTNFGIWTLGPSIPSGLGAPDAPAAMMPNGKILCALAQSPYASGSVTNVFNTPTYFFEYDYSVGANGAFTEIHAPDGSFSDTNGPSGGTTYTERMLALPDGTILYTDGSSQLYVYKPDGSPLVAGKPTVQSVTWNSDGSLHLSGKGFNGISAGAAYGDDAQMDSDYPLIRFTDGSGNVYYGRTHHWSSTGVMTGNQTVTTEAILPTNVLNSAQQFTMQIVANGIASDAYPFNPLYFTFAPLTNTETVLDFSRIGGAINESATVTFRITEYDAGGNNDRYWNGSGWISDGNSSSVQLAAQVVGNTWSPAPGVTLPGRGQTRYGPYFIRAVATDTAGNSITNEILVTRSAPDLTLPNVSFDSFPSNQLFTNATLPAFVGTASDPETGIASVDVFLMHSTNPGFEYWNGSSWTATPTVLTTSYNSGFGTWQLASTLPSGGNLPNGAYQVQVSANNNESPTGSQLITIPFSVDYHPIYVWTDGSYTDDIPGNENHDWDNPANWDAGVPDTNGIAIIINHSVSSTGSHSVYALEMSGGTLNTSGLEVFKRLNQHNSSIYGGAINLASNAVWRWSSGNIAGDWSILPGATLNLDTTTSVYFASGTIHNSGLLVWTNSGTFIGGSGATISNTALVELRGNGILQYDNSGSPTRLVNTAAAVIRKVSGTNTVFGGNYSGWQFENSGQIDIQTGALTLNGTRNYLLDGGSITGAGELLLQSGASSIAGTTTFTNSTFAMNASTLIGTGQFSGTGTFDWQSGNITSGANITLGANMDTLLSSAGTKQLYGSASVNNAGHAQFVGSGVFILSSDGQFNNSGLFEVMTNATFAYDNSGLVPRFNNLAGGTFRATTTNTAVFSSSYGGVLFNNNGLVDAQSGTLRFSGGASSGEFSAQAGALIEFIAQMQTLSNNTSFTGAGVSRVNGGTLQLSNSGSGSVAVTGTLELLNGLMNGTGEISGSGTVNWNGGTIQANVTLAPELTMNIGSSNSKTLQFGRMENRGTINWLDDGNLTFSAGACLTNTGTFQAQGIASLYYDNGGNRPAFDNGPLGTLRKSGNTTNTFHSNYGGIFFHNYGTIDAQGGVLSFINASKVFYSGGSITGPARIRNGSGTISIAGMTALDGGALEFANGEMDGAGGFTGNGTLDWTGGIITRSALITNDVAVTMLIEPGPAKTITANSALQHNGTAIVTDPAGFVMNQAAAFNNSGVFEVRTNSGFYYDNNGNRPVFNNLVGGTFRKTGTNISFFSPNYGGIPFNNAGLVDVQGGTLRFGGGGSSTGEFSPESGAELEFNGGTQTLGDGASFTGAGISRIANAGTVNLNNSGSGAVTISGALELVIGGNLGGNGKFTGSGALNWNGGNIFATTTFDSGLTMNIASSSEKYFALGRITNFGTVNWFDDGTITFGNGGSFTNNGLFHAQGSAAFQFDNVGGSVAFDNGPTGTFRKSGGADTTFGSNYGGVQFRNWGMLDIQSAVLAFHNSHRTFFDGGSITGAGRVKSVDGVISLNGTTALNGGTLEIAGGEMDGAGGFTGNGTFNWSGGSITRVAQITNGVSTTMLISAGGSKWLGSSSSLQQNGIALVTDPSGIVMSGGAVWNNAGLFEIRTNTAFYYDNQGGHPAFNNLASGTVRNVAGSGLAQFSGNYGGITFTNSGVVDLRNGTLAFNVPNAATSSAETRVALNSTTNYPSESFASLAQFNGALTVTFTNGFVPTNGAVFSIANYGSSSGQFAPVNLPSLPTTLKWNVNYGATALTLTVEQAHLLSVSGKPVNGQFQMTFTGPAVSAAILQSSTNLKTWISLQTNMPFTGTFDFTDPQASEPAKFYRVLVVP